MNTNIRFNSRCDEYTSFEVNGKYLMYVDGFKDGFATIEASAGWLIHDFARLIEGCFSPNSNFEKELFKAFNSSENPEFNGIKCVFNGVHICTATKDNFDSNWIVSRWREHFPD